jgi:RHS repeat-associated protein
MNADGLPDRVRRTDINGDGADDSLLVALNLGYSFAPEESWGDISLGSGSSESGSLGPNGGLSFNSGDYAYAGGITFSKTKSRPSSVLLDINGDGLPDDVAPTGEEFSVRFNTGDGFTQQVVWHTAPESTVLCDDPEFRGMPGGINWPRVLLCDGNTGKGAGIYATIAVPLCIIACWDITNGGADGSENMARQEAGLRDVNGDGLADHISSQGEATLNVAPNLVADTNLLHAVTRPLGARFEITYERSGNTFEQPQSRWVMARVDVFDGQRGLDESGVDRDGVDTQSTQFSYDKGYYDRVEREFYGYADVTTKQLNADGSVARSVQEHYLNDASDGYYRKGLLESRLTLDEHDKPLIKTINNYVLRDLVTAAELANPANTTARVFPELQGTKTQYFEGSDTPRLTTRMTYGYDHFGNLAKTTDEGDEGVEDDRITIVQYSNCESQYIVGIPADVVVKDGAGGELRHTSAGIDCERGDITHVREFLDDKMSADSDFEYYPNGNLKRFTGPPNVHQQRYFVTYEYDDLTDTYPTRTTDTFGYSSHATYDFRFGTVAEATDVSGNQTTYFRDTFGRPTSIRGPYEQGDGPPTIALEYHPEADVPWAETRHLDTSRSDTLDSVVFVDGTGRVTQTKHDATIDTGGGSGQTDVMVVSGPSRFDALGRTVETHYPVTEAPGSARELNKHVDPVAPTKTTYDALDRVLTVTLPDESTTTNTYGFDPDRGEKQRFSTTSTDPNGAVKTTFKDVRGEVTAVRELNRGPVGDPQTIWTSYRYDPLGELVEVTDDHENVTRVTYDQLGRRTAVETPDSGLTEMGYDLASNLTSRITALLRRERRQITYDYEFQRLVGIDYPGASDDDVTYTYGAADAIDNSAGRITAVAHGAGTEHRTYGKLGEITKNVVTVRLGGVTKSYETAYNFDSFGRLRALTYPDGEVLTYDYDAGGQVHGASGRRGRSRYSYVRRIGYDKFGQRAYLELGNGTKTSYGYRSDNRRLEKLSSTLPSGVPFQNLAYTYDLVGNLKSITNSVGAATSTKPGGPSRQLFSYDDLGRLTHAEGTYQYIPPATPGTGARQYDLTIGYDTIDNIAARRQSDRVRQKTGRWAPQPSTTINANYSYDDVQPHAVDRIANRLFTYDANGNQKAGAGIAGAARTLTWDAANRLRQVVQQGTATSYVYDDQGGRVLKRTRQGTTLYINQFFSVQPNGVVMKNIIVGPTRIASRLVRQAGTDGELFYYHSDHLRSTHYVSDAAHRLQEHVEYLPYGQTWVAERRSRLSAPYLFTSKELDAETGLYYFGERYYDPTSAAFLSSDPLIAQKPERAQETPRSLNAFAYAVDNPIRFVDPEGLAEEDTTPAVPAPAPRNDRSLDLALNVLGHLGATGRNIPKTTPRETTDLDKLAMGYLGMWMAVGAYFGALPAAGAVVDAGLARAGAWIAVRAPWLAAVLGIAGGGQGTRPPLSEILPASPEELAARAEGTANDVHAVLNAVDPIAANMRTTAVVVAETQEGNLVNVIGGSRPMVWEQAESLGLDEVIGQPLSKVHAEMNALDYVYLRNWTPVAIGVSRPICPICQITIEEGTGGTFLSPTQMIWQRASTGN